MKIKKRTKLISFILNGMVYLDYICTECNKYFRNNSTYRRHMRDYHTDSDVQVHSQPASHTNNMFQFDCEFCDKTFRTRGLLINHKSARHRDMANNSASGYRMY